MQEIRRTCCQLVRAAMLELTIVPGQHSKFVPALRGSRLPRLRSIRGVFKPCSTPKWHEGLRDAQSFAACMYGLGSGCKISGWGGLRGCWGRVVGAPRSTCAPQGGCDQKEHGASLGAADVLSAAPFREEIKSFVLKGPTECVRVPWDLSAPLGEATVNLAQAWEAYCKHCPRRLSDP